MMSSFVPLQRSALAYISSRDDGTLTLTNVVVGTLAYMAPEQQEGRLCDARTDIYMRWG
jgi:serine/threonine protein kinase